MSRPPARPRPAKTDTIGKGLAVLRCFIDGQEEWGVRELAAALGQPSSSIHRLLLTLRREGYLDFDPAVQRYRVGVELQRISSAVARRARLPAVAAPVMRELQQRTGESVALAVLDAPRRRVAYIHEQPGEHPHRLAGLAGRDAPLAADAAGLAILAALPPAECAALLGRGKLGAAAAEAVQLIRSQGYAIEPGARHAPTIMLAAAIRNEAGSPVAALVLAVPGYRFHQASERGLAATVVRAAEEVSARLGARILGGASAGSWHDGLEVLAALIRDRVPGVSTVPSLGGGARNLVELQEGRGAYCMTTLASAAAARDGMPPFATRDTSLCAVAVLSRLHLHVVLRRGVRLDRFEDVRGLRVAAGLSGFSTYSLLAELLGLAGIGAGAMRSAGGEVVEFDYAEAARQLEAGTLDAVFALVLTETSLFRGLVAAGAGRVVGLEPAMIERLVAANPSYEHGEIPAGTYAGQAGPIATVAVRTLLATTTRRSAEEVHMVARLIHERRTDLARVSPAYEGITPDTAVAQAVLPLHPGAAAYWSEQRRQQGGELLQVAG